MNRQGLHILGECAFLQNHNRQARMIPLNYNQPVAITIKSEALRMLQAA
jgi:hypothetical protein